MDVSGMLYPHLGDFLYHFFWIMFAAMTMISVIAAILLFASIIFVMATGEATHLSSIEKHEQRAKEIRWLLFFGASGICYFFILGYRGIWL